MGEGGGVKAGLERVTGAPEHMRLLGDVDEGLRLDKWRVDDLFDDLAVVFGKRAGAQGECGVSGKTPQQPAPHRLTWA